MGEREEKVIGILGGMGPEATVDCFAKIIRNTPARRDQDHLRVVIDSNPKVPDRTPAILGRGESPVPLLASGVEALERAGADFVIIPCVSAHFFLGELRRRVRLPVLSIFDTVAETIERRHPEVKKVGLLATTGTIEGGQLQRRLDESGRETLVPEGEVQARIMAAIYDIKETRPARSRTEIRADLVAAAEGLIARGAGGIVAACTEIPLALSQEDLAVPYFDSLLLLARAAIRRAGREPVPLP
jgi:aspartate racemase